LTLLSPWVLSDPLRLFRSHRWVLCLLSVPLPLCCRWGLWFLSVPWLRLDLCPAVRLHPSRQSHPSTPSIRWDPWLPLDLFPEDPLRRCCRWSRWSPSGLSLPLDLFPEDPSHLSSPSHPSTLSVLSSLLRRWDLCPADRLPPSSPWGLCLLSIPWLRLDRFPEDPLHLSSPSRQSDLWVLSGLSLPLGLFPAVRLHLSFRWDPLSQWLLCCRWDLWIQSGLSLPLGLFPAVRLRPLSPLRLSRRLVLDLHARPLRRWSLWFLSTPSSSHRRELPAARWSLSSRLGLFLLSTP